jgi:hypothetical protein
MKIPEDKFFAMRNETPLLKTCGKVDVVCFAGI